MEPLLKVIGIGSPQGEDRLGWEAARSLEGLEGVTIVCLDRPGPSLLHALEGETAVVLLDAMEAGLPPGCVRVLRAGDLLTGGDAVSSHDLGVAGALALGRALGSLPERLWLIGIQGRPHGGLGERERAAALTAVRRQVQALRGWRATGASA
ncbi:MAG: hydrogenase maturation protease [Ectothiorhodospira sp.]